MFVYIKTFQYFKLPSKTNTLLSTQISFKQTNIRVSQNSSLTFPQMLLYLLAAALLVLQPGLPSASAQTLDKDLIDLNSYDIGRTLYFNSTYAGYWIVGGIIAAVIIVKIIAVGVYLYDYYYTPARVDVDYGQYYQNQGYNSQQAYASYRR